MRERRGREDRSVRDNLSSGAMPPPGLGMQLGFGLDKDHGLGSIVPSRRYPLASEKEFKTGDSELRRE
jgi:hypothetical protein